MRCFLSYLVLFAAVSLSVLSSDTVHAANNSDWFQNDIDQTTATYSDGQQRGQCHGESVTIYNYATENLSPSYVCLADTNWGSMTRSGYIRVVGGTTYYKVSLPNETNILFTPQSDRLYLAHQESSGYIRIGHANAPTALGFNTLTKMYNPPSIISYIPGNYIFVRFSNDASYAVGLTNTHVMQRVLLSDLSVATSVLPSSINVSTIKDLAISNDGSLVLVRSENNSLTLVDFEACVEHGVDACQTRVLSDGTFGFQDNVESIFIDDTSEQAALFTVPSGNNVTRLAFSPIVTSRYVSYVALGDSYSSGEGTWSYLPGTDGDGDYAQEKCHQGYVSYATEYYNQYRAIFDRSAFGSSSQGMRIGTYLMAACSGAKTEHVWQQSLINQDNYFGQYGQFKSVTNREERYLLRTYAVESQIPGRALQRDFLAYYQPDIATIGIGGNDVDFAGTIKACLSFSTCPQASSKRAESGKLIQGKFDVLVATFEDLHAASPSTRLYAVGYPLFVADDSWFCGVNTVLDRTERTFIKESIRYLNDVIEAAAKKAGIGYIDIENSLGNGVLCGSGTSAVNGISLGDDIAVPGTNIMVAGQESFHPNSHGYELEAGTLLDEYGELDTYPNYNCPTTQSGYCPDASVTAPPIASYFGASNQSGVVDTKSMTSPTLFQRLLQLSLSGLRGLTVVRGAIYSEERSLGTYQVNADGTFSRTIELPSELEPGYHTIYFSGTLESGEPFEYQQVILYLPPEAKTGPCGILPYSNIDQDSDEIDDACDPFIDVENPMAADPSTILIYPNKEQVKDAAVAQNTIPSNSSAGSSATPLSDNKGTGRGTIETPSETSTEGELKESFIKPEQNGSEQTGTIRHEGLLPGLVRIGIAVIVVGTVGVLLYSKFH